MKSGEICYKKVYRTRKQSSNADALLRITLNVQETEFILNNPGYVNKTTLAYNFAFSRKKLLLVKNERNLTKFHRAKHIRENLPRFL